MKKSIIIAGVLIAFDLIGILIMSIKEDNRKEKVKANNEAFINEVSDYNAKYGY